MNDIKQVVEYLRNQGLLLTTAESCTAGGIMTALAEVEGSGELIECGYVVYSPQAKQRLLNVNPATMEKFNLTSREVAYEMAAGALHNNPATAAIATTGLLGPADKDGIPAGTICFAWAFETDVGPVVFSSTEHFAGSRQDVLSKAVQHALQQLPYFHRAMLRGERS
ncbi:MAG: CinA family protein [Halopseudomonas sp.]|uniref:CinA family protein n=1 Tax=Halopseudomonas sp. TaxID=2901191 RepID=UPI003002EA8F